MEGEGGGVDDMYEREVDKLEVGGGENLTDAWRGMDSQREMEDEPMEGNYLRANSCTAVSHLSSFSLLQTDDLLTNTHPQRCM